MTAEVALLQHIHQGADMGISSIKHVMSLANDTTFINSLNNQLQEYQEVLEESASLLKKNNKEPESTGMFAKMMSKVQSDMKSMTDHSPSKLAQIMIEGSTMGTTNLTKQLHAYSGSDHTVTVLAKKLLRTEERNIEEMKKFL